MKRFIKLLVLVVLLGLVIPNKALAESVSPYEQDIICFEDGSYITVELVQFETRALNMTTGSKNYVYRNSNGVEQWRVVLTGTFSYNGSSANCTVSACDVTITDSDWYVISKTATKSGNVARANVTMGEKYLGNKIDERAISIKLTCDARGNLT